MIIDLIARCLSRRRLYAVNRLLLRIALRGLGFDNWRSLEESGEAWVVQTALPQVISNAKPVFLDVGAHTGEYSDLLLARFPNAIVHAFEPHPRTYQSLVQAMQQRALCHQLALGSQVGEFELFDRKDHDGSVRASLSREALDSVRKEALIAHRVRVSTVDQFMIDNSIQQIDFMKVDTEGFEMDVFQGAAEALRDGRIRAVQFEFNQLHIGRRQFLRDFQEQFPNHRLYRILRDGLIPLDQLIPVEREIFTFQNILALPVGATGTWS